MYKAGCGPRLDAEQVAVLKAGGKSVEELTGLEQLSLHFTFIIII